MDCRRRGITLFEACRDERGTAQWTLRGTWVGSRNFPTCRISSFSSSSSSLYDVFLDSHLPHTCSNTPYYRVFNVHTAACSESHSHLVLSRLAAICHTARQSASAESHYMSALCCRAVEELQLLLCFFYDVFCLVVVCTVQTNYTIICSWRLHTHTPLWCWPLSSCTLRPINISHLPHACSAGHGGHAGWLFVRCVCTWKVKRSASLLPFP